MPDDYTLQTEQTYEAQVTFVLTVIDPCTTTQLDDLIIVDMSVKVHDLPLSELVPEIRDSVSVVVGDVDGQNFCGDIVHELVEPEAHASYLTFKD